nr:HAD hydrolase-like protein [Flavobacterium sp. N501239]
MTIQKKYDGILFDLDGTLLNTLGIYTHIMNELLKKNNFPTHTSKNIENLLAMEPKTS